MGSIFTISILQSALELGFIYSLVVLALFVSFSILNIADLSTDGCFTLGCAVAASVTIAGHPVLALFLAMGAGIISGFVTAFLQTRLGVESILAGIIVNTGLYTINIAAMGFSSNMNLFKCDSIFTIVRDFIQEHMGDAAVQILIRKGWYKLILVAVIVIIVCRSLPFKCSYCTVRRITCTVSEIMRYKSWNRYGNYSTCQSYYW